MASSTTPSSTTEKPSYGTPDFRVEDKLLAHSPGLSAEHGGSSWRRPPVTRSVWLTAC